MLATTHSYFLFSVKFWSWERICDTDLGSQLLDKHRWETKSVEEEKLPEKRDMKGEVETQVGVALFFQKSQLSLK